MSLNIDIDHEEAGRWIAEIHEIPGVMAYGQSREEAIARVQTLALRVLVDRIEHGEPVPHIAEFFTVAASG